MIHVYGTNDRETVGAFLLRQQAFATLNGQNPEAFQEETLADFEGNETLSLMFKEDGIIAVADLLTQHPIDGSLWLGFFVVDERLHGTGIAARLYSQLEQQYMRPFQTVFRLGVLPHNERAYRFWKRQGYVYEKNAITSKGEHVHLLKKIIE